MRGEKMEIRENPQNMAASEGVFQLEQGLNDV